MKCLKKMYQTMQQDDFTDAEYKNQIKLNKCLLEVAYVIAIISLLGFVVAMISLAMYPQIPVFNYVPTDLFSQIDTVIIGLLATGLEVFFIKSAMKFNHHLFKNQKEASDFYSLNVAVWLQMVVIIFAPHMITSYLAFCAVVNTLFILEGHLLMHHQTPTCKK